MKLVINYDFFNAVRNVNEPLTPLKIVRNEGKYAIFTSLWLPYSFISGNTTGYTLECLAFWYAVYTGVDLATIAAYKKAVGEDKYTFFAKKNLKSLPGLLDSINVKTDYDMLLNSELYEKRYKFESNDTGLIPIKEEKYIYVPSYGFDGKKKETSILQEHNIGSSNYLLSVEEPEKRYRRVLVNNRA